MIIAKIFLQVTSKGCSSNLLENSKYRKFLTDQGYDITSKAKDADSIIINSCAYSEEAENETVSVIENYKRKFPGKKIIIGGCLPKGNPNRLKSIHSGATFDPDRLDQLHSILKPGKVPNLSSYDYHCHFDDLDISTLPWSFNTFFKIRNLFLKTIHFLGIKYTFLENILLTASINNDFYIVPVARGCLGNCTYCSIKKARGSLVSYPLKEIIYNIQEGISKGYTLFWLAGEDIGCWGQDHGENIVTLLNEINKINNSEIKVAVNYFGPSWLNKYFTELLPIFENSKFMSIYVPLHSGSEKIIRKMGRNYNPKTLLSNIKKLKKSNQNISIKTNFMVGFVSETNLDFIRSILALRFFDIIMINKYSVRPDTAAARFDNHINPLMKTVRYFILKALITLQHILNITLSLRFIRFSLIDRGNKRRQHENLH